MNVWLVLPIIIPLTAAAVGFAAWRSRPVQRAIGMIGGIAHLGASIGLLWSVRLSGIQVVQVGGWSAPFGITLVADLFSAVMILVTGLMGVVTIAYSLGSVDEGRERHGYYPLFQILLMGVSGAFLTGDLFNLFVWFEVMLIASFVLMVLGGQRAQMEGAIKYVTLNLVSSALFLTAVGVLYGVAGTLNMADLAVKLRETADPALITALATLFLVAFGIKAAAFPLFFWLPASYHTPPVAISAIFAALLTKVGVYALVRVFTLIFLQDTAYTHSLILAVAALTMVTGVLGAVAQSEMRRLLSFHIVSQIGYLLMGLGLLTTAALAGTLFFMVHVVFSKSMLFLVGGLVHRRAGTYELKELGGLYRAAPGLSILFLIPALSLGGIPPFSGFFAKLTLIQAGLEVERFIIVATAVVVSVLTLFSMLKIWTEVFWKAPPDAGRTASHGGGGEATPRFARGAMVVPTVLLGVMIVAMGVAAGPALRVAYDAAEQLMDPTRYVAAVLGAIP